MCETRANDPNDASQGETVVSDCHSCGCTKSSNHGQHSFYNGTCTGCGKRE